ncbi:hypothetical protein [Sedimenticola selenatireducens]|uniref:hypothetical protein n=1 Tax=Sedimenticola selenatireducens TaxID=191960 RepID=UPI002AABB555|nr:hypothetical protein [Sedimenticola selenatireducens]
MKRTIIIAAILYFTAANAEEKTDWRGNCKKLGGMAEQIMQFRQDGAAIDALIDVAEGSKLMEGLVFAAFDQTRYHTKKMQTRAVREFKNDVYLDCAKMYRKARD